MLLCCAVLVGFSQFKHNTTMYRESGMTTIQEKPEKSIIRDQITDEVKQAHLQGKRVLTITLCEGYLGHEKELSKYGDVISMNTDQLTVWRMEDQIRSTRFKNKVTAVCGDITTLEYDESNYDFVFVWYDFCGLKVAYESFNRGINEEVKRQIAARQKKQKIRIEFAVTFSAFPRQFAASEKAKRWTLSTIKGLRVGDSTDRFADLILENTSKRVEKLGYQCSKAFSYVSAGGKMVTFFYSQDKRKKAREILNLSAA